MKKKVLIVEDCMTLAGVCMQFLNEEFETTLVDSISGALAEVERVNPDIILLDVWLPDGNGLDLLDAYPPALTGTSVIVMTGDSNDQIAIDAIGHGAFDFIEKPFNRERLLAAIHNALTSQAPINEIDEVGDAPRAHFCDFIGESKEMRAVYRVIEAVAPSDATVFVTGESGTGKELTASAIHAISKRRNGPFHAINCGAIPKELMESALFGHVKGAFTGALAAREGAASIADGGTLFLDEICEMDLELQTKMLRFIQTGEFQRVGSDIIERADVRFICATNRDPLKEVKAGRFREDLYYRLHVVPVKLPPLRERGDDVLTIAEHFLHKFAAAEGKAFTQFSSRAVSALQSYNWPGNVRELQNVIQNAVVLNDGHAVMADMLPLRRSAEIDLPGATDRPTPITSAKMITGPEIEPLWKVEQRAIEEAIAACDGNISRAAALLEVSPSTIYRKKQQWEEMTLASTA